MNKYQSHKIVDAARITRFDASHDAEGAVCYDIDLEGDDEEINLNKIEVEGKQSITQ